MIWLTFLGLPQVIRRATPSSMATNMVEISSSDGPKGMKTPRFYPLTSLTPSFGKKAKSNLLEGPTDGESFPLRSKMNPRFSRWRNNSTQLLRSARLVVGLLQTRHAEMEDKIQSVLEMSLEALNTCLRLEKDSPKHNLPKHNAMFLLAALDWATYWYEHKDQRLSFEGFEAFEKAVIESNCFTSTPRFFLAPLTSNILS